MKAAAESSKLTTFSKVSNLKVPDSPPPEQEDPIPGAQPGMTKFETLMKAAVGIKTAQLDSKKRKFEKLPGFLKAGLYYSNKLEAVRAQRDFNLKVFSYEIIRDEGMREFKAKNYDRACRKFEEALGIFRYHLSSNPKWQEQGIDDDEIEEHEDLGRNDLEKTELRRIKLSLYLNIAACNLKTKDYDTAFSACNEALTLDPSNINALFRRALALSLPINSGVEDFRLAIVDLKRILNDLDSGHLQAQRELLRLQKLIEVNRKRERDTYSKMFSSGSGISDYVEEKRQKMEMQPNYKSMEDQEYEKERRKMEEKVKLQMKEKLQEFSFEVVPEKEMKQFPEMEDLQEMIDKAEESYRLFKKTGRGKEAKIVRQKLEEAIFAKEHLFHVMNLDFTRPTQKLITMAAKNNIDLNEPGVIAEFKRIQQQNLDDIRRMKEGKKPLTDDEMKVKLQSLRDAEQTSARKKLEEAQRRKDESVKNLVQNAFQAQESTEKLLKDKDQIKHYVALAVFMAIWMGFIVYQNIGGWE